MLRYEKRYLVFGSIITFIFGIAIGFFRYKTGTLYLLLGLIVGIFIPKITLIFMKNIQISKKEFFDFRTFFITLFLILLFLLGQLFAVSLFENPIDWLFDIISSRKSEAMLLFLMDYLPCVSGGLWIFFNLLDLAFMHFMLLVFTNVEIEKLIKKDKK